MPSWDNRELAARVKADTATLLARRRAGHAAILGQFRELARRASGQPRARKGFQPETVEVWELHEFLRSVMALDVPDRPNATEIAAILGCTRRNLYVIAPPPSKEGETS